jgi:hypothetical protein
MRLSVYARENLLASRAPFGSNDTVPIVPVLALIAGLLVFTLVMLPLSIVLRFRAGSTRRRAWGWLVSLNLGAALLSSALLFVTAAVSSNWIPNSFRYTLIGSACGFALGFVGLALSRWETTAQNCTTRPTAG